MGDFDQQREALADGATDYIVKPFTPERPRSFGRRHLDPKKREEMAKERAQKSAQLRTITDIMHRDR